MKISLILLAASALALASCSAQTKALDQTKLYVGVPLDAEGMPVALSLRLTRSLSVKAALGISLPPVTSVSVSEEIPSSALSAMDGQDPGAVFYDLSAWAAFSDARGGLSFGLWLADAGNSLKVRTVALGGLVASSFVPISKAGVWFVSVAQEDGQAPYGFDPDSESTYQPCYVVKGGLL